IHVFRVVNEYGLISIFRDNSFLTRTSPSSVFFIKCMVIDDTKSAILSTAILTSGLSANLVYPGMDMSVVFSMNQVNASIRSLVVVGDGLLLLFPNKNPNLNHLP